MNKKQTKRNKAIIITSIASMIVGVVLIGSSVTSANLSFWDRIAEFAGIRIADKVDIPSFEEKLGSFPGPDVYNDINIHGKLTDGGKVTNASSTLKMATTLTAKQVCESSIITFNSDADSNTESDSSLDITLPATSTLWTTCLQEEGAHTSFWIANLSPTAASTTQIVAGGGTDLLEPNTDDDFNVEIGGGDRAKIEIWRQTAFEPNFDAYVTVTEYSAAD